EHVNVVAGSDYSSDLAVSAGVGAGHRDTRNLDETLWRRGQVGNIPVPLNKVRRYEVWRSVPVAIPIKIDGKINLGHSIFASFMHGGLIRRRGNWIAGGVQLDAVDATMWPVYEDVVSGPAAGVRRDERADCLAAHRARPAQIG